MNQSKNIVLSLYDFTGETMQPWAAMGFECHCFDIQHPPEGRVETVAGGGEIHYEQLDLWTRANVMALAGRFKGRVAFMASFPVCTDMAVSGAPHFATKKAANPDFQVDASNHAKWCGDLGDALGCAWFVENPVSVLSSFWRKPDHAFNPFEFGGYIPADQAEHPKWPDYIAPRDAYPKKTCLWTGGGFILPEKRPVTVEPGYARQHKMLGGKSMKTKNIRSATPRGFARAVAIANHPEAAQEIAAQ